MDDGMRRTTAAAETAYETIHSFLNSDEIIDGVVTPTDIIAMVWPPPNRRRRHDNLEVAGPSAVMVDIPLQRMAEKPTLGRFCTATRREDTQDPGRSNTNPSPRPRRPLVWFNVSIQKRISKAPAIRG
ncbi:MAG: hypothetical protein Q7J26_12830 [Brevundimonas sp.]|uniref:hypothetical protein n=1 Tax=Brevundimonas sp. TaxID=1871086 RepID=UPI0027251242|nr:hypothetical protein [Brevundimonas sp.]MDO9609402.1 hypothetical protein [Brevundimonas sp.]